MTGSIQGAGTPVVVGLIADTHGLYRPEVADALAGVSRILHAGDVGGERVLRPLRAIAPVHAVWGNVDDPADPALAASISIRVGGRTIHVSHGHELGKPAPERLFAAYPEDVLIFGHTHRALIERDGTRLVINPGAAGPRRFNLQPSVARLTITHAAVDAEIIWLTPARP